MEPLNGFELAQLRERHQLSASGTGGVKPQRCALCNQPAPCDVIRLLDEHQSLVNR